MNDQVVVDPARLGQTVLVDGRRLAWAEWGPGDGRPVLFCPGAATSRWLGFAGDVLDALGVRLISVDRPGLGGSDPLPGRSLLDWAADVRQLAESRELTGLAAVGLSQGAPFALACAATGVVTGAAVVSGTDELANPGFGDALHPDVRGMVAAAAADPVAAEASFAAFGSAEVMWDLIVRHSHDVDRRVYTEPVFAAAYRRALAEGFAQGPAGYARDTLLANSPWPFDPADITVAVDLWYGALDTSLSHSPDHGGLLAARLPDARRHVLPEAGGALLWTHGEQVLRDLLSGVAKGRSATGGTASAAR
ncbi:alpha/beta fold hydrolase [Goodfellowiella coeruleoviolacea]|uniref:Pimeloyl-ACP methyl ester carboxylesterase n=1 Tax=Goodfellowiella coeruleoviolacea TaxID=334858 RepID=A0AAE3KFL1_9PSEU|nr:alpha/beta hydrolase [Goodfellowiella coeruleoviolacea]MCP2166476.1 Pimeloyl-ACP methyl ester carboxylesterase [Goodfellowiella coeruleoviolacea]